MHSATLLNKMLTKRKFNTIILQKDTIIFLLQNKCLIATEQTEFIMKVILHIKNNINIKLSFDHPCNRLLCESLFNFYCNSQCKNIKKYTVISHHIETLNFLEFIEKRGCRFV